MAEPVILVHGTFAGPKDGALQWYQPGSEFCAALDRALEARKVDARCWSGIPEYFHWGPGDNTWVARAEAAQKLRDLLQKLNVNCHIVAHSHGGNVVLEALGWEDGSLPAWFDGTVTLLGTPLIVLGQRHKSYVAGYVIALLLVIAAGIALTPTLYTWWAVALPLALLFVFLVAVVVDSFDLFPHGLRIFAPEATLLLINSQHDEAYKLLSAVAISPNPMLADKRKTLFERFAAAIHECWLVAKNSAALNKGQFSWRAAGMLVFLALAALDLLLGFPVSGFYAYWAVIATVASVLVLIFQSSATQDGSGSMKYMLNVGSVFVVKLLKYPFARTMTGIAKRMSWPLVKAYALGLVDSPTPIDTVHIAQHPASGKHEYKELPEEIAAEATAKRNRSVQVEMARFIDAVSNSQWSVESVRQYLRELNEPGLVHSCYYSLDQSWVIDTIVAHIESYQHAEQRVSASLTGSFSPL